MSRATLLRFRRVPIQAFQSCRRSRNRLITEKRPSTESNDSLEPIRGTVYATNCPSAELEQSRVSLCQRMIYLRRGVAPGTRSGAFAMAGRRLAWHRGDNASLHRHLPKLTEA
jgi:hypothetical protein